MFVDEKRMGEPQGPRRERSMRHREPMLLGLISAGFTFEIAGFGARWISQEAIADVYFRLGRISTFFAVLVVITMTVDYLCDEKRAG
ncbi:hypothetical protein C4556_03680 [Candidatus Parcubacteria bacterium]|nr:MAG: hypothetical protein C4556_03680 [Candidatus Parcubacteria bacterium]